MTRVPLHRIDIASAAQPTQVIPGQLWYDSVAGKLKIYNGATFDEYSLLTDVDSKISIHRTETGAHAATKITVDTSAAVFSSATEVQGLTNDLGVNFYDPYMTEHKNTGAHGPKVTVSQTANDDALSINKSGTGAAILLNTSGTVGAFGIHAQQNTDGRALYIEKINTGGVDSAGIVNAGSGIGLRIVQNGLGNALVIDQNTNAAGLVVTKTATGTGDCLYVVNQGTSAGLAIRQQNTGSAVGGISIENSGTGNDVTGNNNNWAIDKSGNAIFLDVPKLAVVQQLAPGAVGVAYADMINTSINVPKTTSSVLITLTCMVTGVGSGPTGTDFAAALELRTAAGGGGSQIVEKNPWYNLNPNAHGWDELTIPMVFRYIVVPGVAGVYAVYARMKQVYTPGTIVNMVLTLESIG